ncbi:NAD(P)H-dependent flavin oxidoreductase [Streptomyces nondiastaticus]|uniref:NAD(P)H-dependent flavin oxidoreductase n=1 Tax=Streptomyces nondiastaticus TaxID=3154512 RepID=A0ABW6UBU6_9ACTN
MSARLCDALGIDVPLLQAGMGGVAGPELAGAVSEAGAGGCLALYKERPEHIPALVEAVRRRTGRAFGINIIPEVVGDARAEEQLSAALGALPDHAFLTFFGLPGPRCTALLRRVRRVRRTAGRAVVVQVGSVADAGRAVDQGADVVVLQNRRAGGHLLGDREADDLLEGVRHARPDLPLVTAGGIGDGRDLAAAERRGADGALCGTLFVPAAESDAHPVFKERVLRACSAETVVTGLYRVGWPGRRHRVLRTSVTEAGPGLPEAFISTTEHHGRRYPVPRYSAATPTRHCTGRVEEMAMYCGESVDRVRSGATAAAVVAEFRRRYDQYGGRGERDERDERKPYDQPRP